MSAALVALILAVAVLVLATQASSIWATRNELQVPPGQVIVGSPTDVSFVKSGHIPPGCRPKVGCQNDAAAEKP